MFSKDYIIIPIHLGMHWCCSVIDFKLKQIRYYDSLHGGNSTCLRLLKEYIEQESLDKKKVELDTSDWVLLAPNVFYLIRTVRDKKTDLIVVFSLVCLWNTLLANRNSNLGKSTCNTFEKESHQKY